MSLINDALQRAKQQTAQPATPPGLPLRPIQPVETSKRNSLLLPIICGSVVCVAAVLGLIVFKSNHGTKENAVAEPATTSVPASQVTVPAPAAKPLAVVKVEEPKLAAAASAEPTTQVSNISMNAEAPALRPAPLKLQAIFYSATKPSAMLNGKTVYVGNRVGEFRVAAITQTSATLISDSATNVLSFQE